MSLVEVTIAMTILCIVASSAMVATRTGIGAYETTNQTSELENRLHRALDRTASELAAVIADELQPNPTTELGTSDLLFRSAVGLVGTQPQPGEFVRLRREYDPLELDDGLDNDGDGLVDEGMLVLLRDEGGIEHRVVLANGVAEAFEGEAINGVDDNGNGVRDELGFNVHREGDVLFLRLCLQKATERDVVTRSLTTSIRLRN